MTTQGFDGRPVRRPPSWSLWVSGVFMLILIVYIAAALIFVNPWAGVIGMPVGLPTGLAGKLSGAAIGIAPAIIIFGLAFYCGLLRFSIHTPLRNALTLTALIFGGGFLQMLALGIVWIVWRAMT